MAFNANIMYKSFSFYPQNVHLARKENGWYENKWYVSSLEGITDCCYIHMRPKHSITAVFSSAGDTTQRLNLSTS